MSSKIITCADCGQEVPADDSYSRGGQTLCEDCFLKGSLGVKACDPFAARSAELFRKTSGIESTEGLTDLQKKICEFVRSQGKTTVDELLNQFPVSGPEMENQLAVLRHCNLVKGQKEGAGVYLVPF